MQQGRVLYITRFRVSTLYRLLSPSACSLHAIDDVI